MSDANNEPQRPDDGLDLTRTIRRLTLPTSAANDELLEDGGTALLYSNNSSATKWAPRWLNQYGVTTTVVQDASDALARARRSQPQAIIVDAGMLSADGQPLYKDFLDAEDLTQPIFVMCSSARETSAALDCDPYDVIRKPFEWAMISRRVKYAVHARNLRERLADGQESLRKALAVADEARQRLRRGESFEPVTGLPNKRKFVDLVRRSMGTVDRDGNALAVIVIGFNRFRLVVEAMGQECADMIMTELGKVLTECLGELGPSTVESQRLRTAAAASIDHSRFAIMVTTSGNQGDLGHLQQLLL
ncbi:MAG: diguanylate cyclase, partial [Gammaproteobacteria bacterium]|nr:diguanylate cyclase [Gammaproteobacteria bacterium]